MNFNLYLDKELSDRLSDLCEKTHKRRNMVIREALEFYLAQHQKQVWPSSILDFKGIKEAFSFEAYRRDMLDETRPSFLDDEEV